MATITIRNLPPEVMTRLKERAKRNGRSMEGEAREILGQSLAPYDAETRFKAMATEADIPAALDVLDRLDG